MQILLRSNLFLHNAKNMVAARTPYVIYLLAQMSNRPLQQGM
jgi:hypothetical protein